MVIFYEIFAWINFHELQNPVFRVGTFSRMPGVAIFRVDLFSRMHEIFAWILIHESFKFSKISQRENYSTQ